MLLSYSNLRNRYELQLRFEQKDLAKARGFLWDANFKTWYTEDKEIAKRLGHHAHPDAAAKLYPLTKPKYDESDFLLEGEHPYYPPYLKPYPFQIDKAVPFAWNKRHAYLALEMGLGKTIVAALIINKLLSETPDAKVVYICPPFLVYNVEAELRKWGLPGLKVAFLKSKNDHPADTQVLIVPDSILASVATESRLNTYLGGANERLIIVDEAHRFKGDSQRMKALARLGASATRSVMLSGTPMSNRPAELFGILNTFGPEEFRKMSNSAYVRRYCDAHTNRFGHWDTTGVAHFNELVAKVVGPYMLRIKKSEVLPDLPLRTEGFSVLDGKGSKNLQRVEKELLAEIGDEDIMQKVLGAQHVASYRRMLGVEKCPLVAELIAACVSADPEIAVLVFFHHTEVGERLAIHLADYNPKTISGRVDKHKRFEIAQEFQAGKGQILLCQTQAAGVGLNLTRATQVFFAESSWVPAENQQAIDRAHRIGQKQKVLAQHFVFPGSLDQTILRMVANKTELTKEF